MIDRLLAKVSPEPTSGCWLWTGAVNNKGYGQMGGYTRKRNVFAHREAFKHYKGPIPVGLELDHKCRNTYCVNPDHLEAVTHAENMRMSRKGKRGASRAAQTHCIHGHAFTAENTAVYYGKRVCKSCRSAWSKKLYAEGRTSNQKKKACNPETVVIS